MKKSYYVKSKKVNVVIDEDSITISRKGFINMANHGLKGEKTIPYTSITATQIKKPGFATGYLQLAVKGGNESKGGVQAAVSDENTILFTRKDEYEVMCELKEFIDTKIRLGQAPPVVQSIQSPVEQVKGLKELLDMGVINQQEFDKKKRELLDL
ncbi:DUF4429 domain-containing protein [Enterococcus wangshanyuanii]|uniref:SHOCT domain-containing protein n=1 Tax=Enterococcus wangshanyuanii TaxID=2005703 RepID=A0ABQ1P2Z3_9ENTE|nr:DUF4429 domain-containing protein [Enterococcus wangshanyuanii]GGC88347.1 hypothetical protein GCM10011573_17460 [Enterococcus wangshanyuanii]